MKKVFAWFIGIVIFISLMSFVPPTSCHDGWNSPSIGRQGTCSHHGGVDDHGFIKLLIGIMSIAAGLGTYKLITKKKK